jgi:sulfur relay (sulfurtransferase) complex TusBCD TusD component (DsrE family)
MKMTFTLHEGRGSAHVRTVVELVRAARRRGHEVTLFLMAEGVTCLADERLVALADIGVTLSVCEYNRKQYAAPEGVARVGYDSQYEFAGFVADADRVVGFLD